MDDLVKARVKCCSCGRPMSESRLINFVLLDRVALWPYPCGGNVLTGEWGRAIAILCDRCIAENREPRFAVEWSEGLEIVIYHPIHELPKLEAVRNGKRREG